MLVKSAIIIYLTLFGSSRGLQSPFNVRIRPCKEPATNVAFGEVVPSLQDNEVEVAMMDRRSLLISGSAAACWISASPSMAESGKKVVVIGGSGYVGAHVDKLLVEQGYTVVSVARSSVDEQARKVKAILGTSIPIEYRSLDASKDDLKDVLAGSTAVVSCVGVIPGGQNQLDGNGAVNVRIAQQAANIDRLVYVSVASELANGPAKFLLRDYMTGKAQAEAAVQSTFGPERSLVVKPAIIAGGPPGELRPPGPPGMTAVAVEDVARAVVAGATGSLKGIVDGNAAITALP